MIKTVTGKRFDFFNMQKNDVDPLDIALGLGRKQRYAGQGLHCYSSAEHSVFVAEQAMLRVRAQPSQSGVQKTTALVYDTNGVRDLFGQPLSPEQLDSEAIYIGKVALLHDATDAYGPEFTRDIKGAFFVRTDKGFVPYEKVEEQLLSVIFDAFGLPPVIPQLVLDVDRDVCRHEQAALFPHHGYRTTALSRAFGCLPPDEATALWLSMYFSLFGDLDVNSRN